MRCAAPPRPDSNRQGFRGDLCTGICICRAASDSFRPFARTRKGGCLPNHVALFNQCCGMTWKHVLGLAPGCIHQESLLISSVFETKRRVTTIPTLLEHRLHTRDGTRHARSTRKRTGWPTNHLTVLQVTKQLFCSLLYPQGASALLHITIALFLQTLHHAPKFAVNFRSPDGISNLHEISAIGLTVITGGASATCFPLPLPFPWDWGAFTGGFLAAWGPAALEPPARTIGCLLESSRVPDPPLAAAPSAATAAPFPLPPFFCALPLAVDFDLDFFELRPFFFGAAWQLRQARRSKPDAATTPTPT